MSVANTINDVAALTFFTPLHELDHDKLTELAERSPLLSFKKGQPLATGIDRHHIVYLLSGSVEHSPNSADAEIIKADSERARQPILAPGKRARVIARSAVEVLSIDAELLDLLLNWGGSGGFEVDEIDTGESADWLNTLMQSDAVLSLSPASIQALMAVVEPVEFQADEVIFEQGDRPDYYYIVSRGRCAVTRSSGEQAAPRQLATLGAGEAFGEEALIANTERSATVRMIEAGLLLRLDRQNFKQLLEQSLVHVIDHDRAQSLKAKGAQLLDLRQPDDFAIDGSGINIPFAELRSRMGDLDRQQQYLLTSDDNRMSAVAAFLLGKQRFKVYVLQTSAAEGFAVKAAAATAQAGELRSQLVTLQQQLDEARAKLAQESEGNSAYRERVQTLEAELKRTQADARRAIAEAGSLKNKSESALRQRVGELNSELESERTRGQTLIAELEQLKEKVAALEEQLQTSRREAEQNSEDASLMRLRLNNLAQELGQERNNRKSVAADNDRLQESLSQLTGQLDEARAQLEQNEQLPQLEVLQAELETQRQSGRTLSERNDELEQRLTALERELQQAREQAEQGSAELAASRGREAELDDSLAQLRDQLEQSQQAREQALAAEQVVRNQLTQFERDAEQQATELAALKAQLQQHQHAAQQAEQAHEALQARLPQLEAELEAGRQAQRELEQRTEVLTRSNSELEETVTLLTRELEQQSQAVVQRDALQQKVDSLLNLLAEKESQFASAESGFELKLQNLENELNSANLNAVKEAAQAEQEIGRLQLRIKVLDQELTGLRGEQRRSGLQLKLLMTLLVTLVGGLGAALYAGVDVQGEVSQLMHRAAPHVNQLVDSLLRLISMK